MNAPLPFQQFQLELGRRLRDPRGTARPSGVPPRRLAIYEELLFNNITGFLDSCFPVSRKLLGERRWRRMHRAFFRDWRSHTPWFREIPREFLRWLEATQPARLPRWLADLAHYEWVELALDVMDAPEPPADPEGDLMAGLPVLAPALMNLAYDWPVQRISPNWRPRKPSSTGATHLLVFRDRAGTVQFVELNPVSARLIALLQEAAITGAAACMRIAAELGHPDPAAVAAGGRQILENLRAHGAILGVQP
jgi:hypothetical protein